MSAFFLQKRGHIRLKRWELDEYKISNFFQLSTTWLTIKSCVLFDKVSVIQLISDFKFQKFAAQNWKNTYQGYEFGEFLISCNFSTATKLYKMAWTKKIFAFFFGCMKKTLR